LFLVLGKETWEIYTRCCYIDGKPNVMKQH